METGDRPRRAVNGTTLVAGLLYIVLGGLFLVERLGWLTLGPQVVVPVLLIGLGAAVLAGTRRRPAPVARTTPVPAPPPQERDVAQDQPESASE